MSVVKELSLVIGVSGASGALYARHFLRALAVLSRGRSRLILSDTGLRVYREEIDGDIKSREQYLSNVLSGLPAQQLHEFVLDDFGDVGGKPASGSTTTDGMVIVPCSMKTLAAISQGYTTNLIERAADVCLKERRRLVVVPREAPYSLIHLRNMTALTEGGGIVLPGSPGFYHRPKTIEELGDFIAARICSQFGLDARTIAPGWKSDE